MDDLLDSFAGQTLESQDQEISQGLLTDTRLSSLEHPMPVGPVTTTPAGSDLESTNEEYKYHFLDKSPPGSEHAMPINPPINPAAAQDPISENEAFGVQRISYPALVDEAEYNGDIDDIDDDDEDFVPEEATDEVEYVRVTETTKEESYNELDEFAQHLRRLHRQDTERDELLIVRNVH